MFRRARNIDTAFRQVRLFALVVVVGALGLAGAVSYKSFRMVAALQARIYVLSGGQALPAVAANRRDHLAVEAREHVRRFHHYFFTLDPDDQVIRETVERALCLADGSAREAYESLRENNFYAALIAGNVSQSIRVDSVVVDLSREPHYFRCRAVQTITRPSSVTTRTLLTEGYLRPVARSDLNPHGFLVERWKTLENADLKTEARRP